MKNPRNHALPDIETALEHHRAGRLQQADAIYQKMPRNPDALHLRGVVAHQLQKNEEAVEFISKAIRANPSNAAYYFSIDLVYRALNRLDEAVASYRNLLAHAPDNAVARNNLGNALKTQHRFDEAAACYRQALALDPAYAAAHSNLGSALAAQGNLDEAAACYQAALALKPDFTEGHYNLAGVLKAQGRLDDAVGCYQTALTLKPDFVDAHNNLGVALKDQGKLDEAAASCRNAIALKPDFVEARINLGVVLKEQGRLDDAIACYREALALRPDSAEAYNNLGNALQDQDRQEEAMACYLNAIELNPDFAQAYIHIGNALQEQRKLDDAVACYQKAVSLEPRDPAAQLNLGNGFKAQNKLSEAVGCYLNAIMLKPDFAEAYNNLGLVFLAQDNPNEAISCYQTAIALKPSLAEAHNNLGEELQKQGRLDDAIACYQAALALKADFPGAHSNLGVAFHTQGKPDKAIPCYREALAHQPDFSVAHNNLLFTMLFSAAYTPEEMYTAHLRFAQQFETPLKAHWSAHRNARDPHRRLKIGYVSPDFRKHPVAYFIEPILVRHDKSQFEIFCYYNDTRYDLVTQHIKELADHWVPCNYMLDEQLAERIRADGIDILIDLAGHTGGNRLLAFARKPAPVQATYLGYPTTTGLAAIDYRITDVHAEPPGMTEALNAEQLWRLPESFCCYRANDSTPEVINHPPAEDNGYVTFGCFNNFSKLTDPVLALWARLLHAVPSARLMLEIHGIDKPDYRAEVESRFIRLGLPLERVIFIPRRPENQYVLYNRIDIALDPFPCNGGTTSLDTVWMGVPFVTLAGGYFTSRMGVTILTNAGMPELIANTEDEYVHIAAALAQDPERLKALRAGLRERVQAGPLMDAQRFTLYLEQAYRGMWRTWCERAPDAEEPKALA